MAAVERAASAVAARKSTGASHTNINGAKVNMLRVRRGLRMPMAMHSATANVHAAVSVARAAVADPMVAMAPKQFGNPKSIGQSRCRPTRRAENVCHARATRVGGVREIENGAPQVAECCGNRKNCCRIRGHPRIQCACVQ